MYCEASESIHFDPQMLLNYLKEVQARLQYNTERVMIVDLVNRTGGDVFAQPSQQLNWSTWVYLERQKRSRPGWAVIDRELDRTIVDLQKCREMGLYHHTQYNKPTNALFGYAEHVVETLKASGIFLTHCWLSRFSPGYGYDRHYHSARGDYFRVLHVPILTDSSVKMQFFADHDISDPKPTEEHHMSAGGCFLIDGSVIHEIVNHGHQDRWHFCANAYDLRANFKLGAGGARALETHLPQSEVWRKYVDEGVGLRFLEWL